MSIFSALFGRRRAKLSEPETLSMFADGESAAGKHVTPNTAMQLAAAWSCVRLLSETIGTLPLPVFEREGENKRIARDHPLYELLHDSPNADQTAAEFWEGMVASLCLQGNGFAEKTVSGAAGRQQTRALTFLNPERVTVRRDDEGARVYRYNDRGRYEDLPEEKVFHLRGFGAGGDVGLSPISYARQTMGSALAADETAAKLFANGLQQPLFIDSGQAKLTPDQRKDIREMIEKFAGSSNAGKILVLEAGMKPVELSFNPEDAQLLQTRSFHVEEICRWFRVPPSMVGHTAKSTSWGTGLEQQMIGFLTFSLRPYLTRIEQAVKKQLIPATERKRLFAEFNLEGLLRADSTGRAAILNASFQNALRTPNENRGLENLPPLPGGDELFAQSNMLPLQMLRAGGTGSDQQARSALLSWLGLDQAVASAVKAALIGNNGGSPLEESE